MARPRNTSIKLVLDVPESVYMELAVKARGVEAHSVSEYVENLLCLDVAKSVPLPLLDGPAATAEVVEGVVPVAEVGGFGPGLDLDKHGKPKRKGK